MVKAISGASASTQSERVLPPTVEDFALLLGGQKSGGVGMVLELHLMRILSMKCGVEAI
jgi:hypothetical protein